MRLRSLALIATSLCVLGVAGGVAWKYRAGQTPAPEPAAADADGDDLPVPPFPPRIAEGEQYEQCMSMIAQDPEGAEAIAASMQSTGIGGDGAKQCEALAKIANGDVETGAEMLETIAHGPSMEGLARAVLLGQAAEARLMADQPDHALRDTTEGIELAPEDADLLFSQATAHDNLDREEDALADLGQVLEIDATRGDALVLRATIWLQLDKLEQARRDIEAALALDPDDPDALLQRGVLRQRTGDLDGARADWIRARDADPNSDTAEEATQNLGLLDSGPKKR